LILAGGIYSMHIVAPNVADALRLVPPLKRVKLYRPGRS